MEKPNKQRGVIGLVVVIIIALAIIGGGGYYITSKDIPNSNLEKYAGTDFEVSYPGRIFSPVELTVALPPDYKATYPGVKLISKNKVNKLGKQECMYGESDLVVVCDTKYEAGIEFVKVNISAEKLTAALRWTTAVQLDGETAVKWSIGAEGSGMDYYFIPLGSGQTLVAARQYESTGFPEQALFDQMLATLKTETNLNTFISQKLGIKFLYATSTNVLEKENKIYVYVKGDQPKDGQSVEAFDKTADESFASAIKRTVLAKFPSTDCKVEVAPAEPGMAAGADYQVARITYPIPDDPNLSMGAYFENADKCNADYAVMNGVRYFLYDPNQPTKFYFFNIGQYGIMAGDKPWQTTFEAVS